MRQYDVAIIGAGPLGIELAIGLKRMGLSYLLFDKGQAAQMVYNFPPLTHFYSSPDRISIANHPLQTIDQQKATREEYLAYIRSVVMGEGIILNSYEEVKRVLKTKTGFELETSKGKYQSKYVVFATGGTSKPRRLDIPGEDLLNVHSTMKDPHFYFQKKVAVIGGRNSAAETTVRLDQAGVFVSLIFRKAELSRHDIKYWILPDLKSRIDKQQVLAFPSSKVLRITENSLEIDQNGKKKNLEIDFVIKNIGFIADISLEESIGIELTKVNEATMESNVSNAYILGTVAGGTQDRYRVFIENCHCHVVRILKSLKRKLKLKAEIPFKEVGINLALEE